MSVSGLNNIERKAAFTLASVFGLRMLGLFMILPVFAIYGATLSGFSPLWIGLAIGAYGLTQAMFQIPMGIFSDRYGRKPIILIGLAIFFIGSVVAALSDSVYGVVIGRALQGMGAIASAVLALAADLTREEQRPKVMATIGMFIGLSFTVAMVFGPVVAQAYGLHGLFWVTALLTVGAMLMVKFIVPDSVSKAPKGDNVALPEKLRKLFFHRELSRLNLGVFILHMALTACFVTLPKQFVTGGLALAQHWQLYLPVLLGSFFLMVPFMIYGIKKKKEKQVFSAAIVLMIIALSLFWYLPSSLTNLIVITALFFTAFNYLEATMPSILSRLAPAGAKGSVMGIYSSCQFLGAFSGGILGGVIASIYGEQAIFISLALIAIIWLGASLTMKPLVAAKSFSFSMTISQAEQADEVSAKLVNMPGVQEVTLVLTEAVAYLKLDDKVADIKAIKALLN